MLETHGIESDSFILICGGTSWMGNPSAIGVECNCEQARNDFGEINRGLVFVRFVNPEVANQFINRADRVDVHHKQRPAIRLVPRQENAALHGEVSWYQTTFSVEFAEEERALPEPHRRWLVQVRNRTAASASEKLLWQAL